MAALRARYEPKKEGKRAAIIKQNKYQSDTISIEAAPSDLKVEKDWTGWSEAFEN